MKHILKSMSISLLGIITWHVLPAQSNRDVDKLYSDCQRCLDNTGYTEKCSSILYNSLDSLLNEAYQQLQRTLPKDQRQRLIAEEKSWLKERDHYFGKVKAAAEEGNPPDTEITNTLILDKENEFVRKRIMELIAKRNAVN